MTQYHTTSLNLIGCPTAYFASAAFNRSPLPVSINGVREMNPELFDTMDRFGPDDVPLLFMEHMRVMFELDTDVEIRSKQQRPISYLRMMRGWFFDSNRPEGAVIKGWAESRFGLRTLYHRSWLDDITDTAYRVYLSEKMHPRFHSNSIYAQFDLLYEYCQYFWERFGPVKKKITLYRGINRAENDISILERTSRKSLKVRNNCLNSYSSCKERASEFGDMILKVVIPFQKLFCSPEIIPSMLPSYENEYIVLGGDYESSIVDFF